MTRSPITLLIAVLFVGCVGDKTSADDLNDGTSGGDVETPDRGNDGDNVGTPDNNDDDTTPDDTGYEPTDTGYVADDEITCYPDGDGDGYGNGEYSIGWYGTECPDGYTDNGIDWCDDNPDAHTYADCGIEDDTDTPIVDNDGDGYYEDEDCDDSDSSINPGATEYCDGVDNDCDGTTDEDSAADAMVWYPDADGDGFGENGSTYVIACEAPSGYVSDSADYCDDNADAVDEDECDEEIPDDLDEGLDWIRVDGDSLGVNLGWIGWSDSSSTPSGDDVVITGSGLDLAWTYNTDYLGAHDASTDYVWFEMDNGLFRVTLMGPSGNWAMYDSLCKSSYTSDLCHENGDATWALCFMVTSGQIEVASSSDCTATE